VREWWSMTATGRRKRLSLEEVLSHWEKNSPQVQFTMPSP